MKLAVPLTALTAGITILAAYLITSGAAGDLQLLATAAIVLLYLGATLVRPTAGLVLICTTLPFLGMFRRILYQQSPVSLDYTLLAIPIYTLIMIAVISVTYRERLNAILHGSTTTRLILLLICIAALQIANPAQGGLAVGLAGTLFYMVPLCWYIIGRIFLTESAFRAVLAVTTLAALIAACYGLSETYLGFLGFDAYWIAHSGYTALQVGGTIRALGPTTSSAEYDTLLGIGTLILVAIAFARKSPIALVPLPLLVWAILLEASRGIVIQGGAAIVILLALRPRSKRLAIIVLAGVVLVVGYLYQGASQTVYVATSASPIQGILTHQINGLTHPFDDRYSTGGLHLQAIWSGFLSALHSPLGLGLGTTSLAAGKFGGVSQTAEWDIVNVFLAMGVIGGALYLLILIRTFRAGVLLTFRDKRVTDAAPLAALVIVFGQILNGGYYSLMPVLWMFIAWIDMRACEEQPGLMTALASSQPKSLAYNYPKGVIS